MAIQDDGLKQQQDSAAPLGRQIDSPSLTRYRADLERRLEDEEHDKAEDDLDREKSGKADQACDTRAANVNSHDPFAEWTHDQDAGLPALNNDYALRIENRRWVNDINLEQAWAILYAEIQQFDVLNASRAERRDLLFMLQLPDGGQPALCLPHELFLTQLPSPAALAARLTPSRQH